METLPGGTHEEERETMSDLNHAHRQPPGTSGGLRQAVANDLLALSRLHAGELDWHSITTLQQRAYDDVLMNCARAWPTYGTCHAPLRAPSTRAGPGRGGGGRAGSAVSAFSPTARRP